MERAEFAKIVERLEHYAVKHPRAYKWRLVMLLALGYGFVLTTGLVSIALSAFMIGLLLMRPPLFLAFIKVGWILPLISFYTLRSLWVTLPRPVGRELQHWEAPELFTAVASLRSKLKVPRIRKILLASEFNAGVTQIPRLGLFGFPRNYLRLGFSLMAVASPEQFQAVLAHELAHLGGQHGRMARRIYQQRATWAALQGVFQQKARAGGWVLRRFLNWYAPYFNAYSFVLARRQEDEADRASVAVVGRETTAQALTLASVGSAYCQEYFWKPFLEQSRMEPTPTQLPHLQMLRSPPTPMPGSRTEAILARELLRRTDLGDTHPALAQRLEAIGASASVAGDFSISAARRYLGRNAEALARELDEAWQVRNAKAWRDRYEQHHRDLGLLTLLDEKFTKTSLSEGEAWQRLLVLERLRGKSVAQPEIERFLSAYPEHSGAQFAAARLRLEDGDESGLDLLRKVMTADGNAIKPGAELAHRFLKARGRNEEAADFAKLWWGRQGLENEAQRERSWFRPGDTYLPASLPAGVIQEIREVLSRNRAVGSAYLVRKEISHLREHPMHLLFLVPRLFVLTDLRKLARAVASQLPTGVSLATVAGSKAYRRIRRVRGARLYRCSWR
jgi:Zn-dependent protease with chaperone function